MKMSKKEIEEPYDQLCNFVLAIHYQIYRSRPQIANPFKNQETAERIQTVNDVRRFVRRHFYFRAMRLLLSILFIIIELMSFLPSSSFFCVCFVLIFLHFFHLKKKKKNHNGRRCSHDDCELPLKCS